MEEEENKVPPVVERADDEETTDFASVIAEQSATITRQQRQIDDLLKAVSNMTAAGANYQEGSKPEPMKLDEEVHESVPMLSELDFKM